MDSVTSPPSVQSASLVRNPSLREWGVLWGVVGLTLLLDQLSKWWVVQTLDYGETWLPVSALRGIFDITYTRNTGAAFGMARDFGNIFLLIAVVVVLTIVYYYRRLPEGVWLMRVALGLQMGGALGNAVDRVTRGFVVDFFHVHRWPIFNIADSAIVCGVGLLIVAMWLHDRALLKAQALSEEAISDEAIF